MPSQEMRLRLIRNVPSDTKHTVSVHTFNKTLKVWLNAASFYDKTGAVPQIEEVQPLHCTSSMRVS